jgi:uncharacterized protein (TIGR02246 family)
MKKILVAALVVTACAVVVERVAAAQVDDGIKQVLGTLDRCFAANDATCVGGLFAEDATYVAPQGEAKVVKGRAQIVEVLAPSMAAFNKQGGKLTHALENVRMIDDAHALVDITITVRGPKGSEKEEEGARRESYRGVALMEVQGGKWVCRDLRSYVIGHTAQGAASGGEPNKGSASPQQNAPTPAAKDEPASPTQG